MIYDNHNHLVANGDAVAMVRAAEERGLTGFLFTEHVFHLDEPRVASRYLGTHWDGGWYQTISREGYSYQTGVASSGAFCPGYPLLIRFLSLGAPGAPSVFA